MVQKERVLLVHVNARGHSGAWRIESKLSTGNLIRVGSVFLCKPVQILIILHPILNHPIVPIVFRVVLKAEKSHQQVLEISIFDLLCRLQALNVEDILRDLSWEPLT